MGEIGARAPADRVGARRVKRQAREDDRRTGGAPDRNSGLLPETPVELPVPLDPDMGIHPTVPVQIAFRNAEASVPGRHVVGRNPEAQMGIMVKSNMGNVPMTGKSRAMACSLDRELLIEEHAFRSRKPCGDPCGSARQAKPLKIRQVGVAVGKEPVILARFGPMPAADVINGTVVERSVADPPQHRKLAGRNCMDANRMSLPPEFGPSGVAVHISAVGFRQSSIAMPLSFRRAVINKGSVRRCAPGHSMQKAMCCPLPPEPSQGFACRRSGSGRRARAPTGSC